MTSPLTRKQETVRLRVAARQTIRREESVMPMFLLPGEGIGSPLTPPRFEWVRLNNEWKIKLTKGTTK